MKKSLFFTTDNRGFILIHVVFVISISLLIIITSIEIYRNNLSIIERQVEHIHYETLFQMGQATLKKEIQHGGLPSEVISYDFPIGTVEIDVSSIEAGSVTFQFIINFHETPSDSYIVQHRLEI